MGFPNELTHPCPIAESKIWVRKVRLVSRVQLATKALKFEVPTEVEVKPEEERRECKLGDPEMYPT